jgi:hypothetical protein
MDEDEKSESDYAELTEEQKERLRRAIAIVMGEEDGI